MAIYTPHGRIIELPLEYGFALLARLGSISPLKVLKTVESLDCIPGLLSISTAMVCFVCGSTPLQIFVAVFLAATIGSMITMFGLFLLIPVLLTLATLYRIVVGWGIVFVVVSLFGFFTSGWQGVLAFLLGQATAIIVHVILMIIKGKMLRKKFGFSRIGSAEINFLHAYQLYAASQGTTTDICVTPEEISIGNWRNCADRLKKEWPERGKTLVE